MNLWNKLKKCIVNHFKLYPEEPEVVYEGQVSMEDYEKFVTKLASTTSMHSFEAKLGTGGLGLSGEAGEVADLVKKLLYHGKEFDEETREKMVSELGDILWYLTFTAKNVCGVSLQEVLDKNVEKLQSRYKTGKFTVEEFKVKEANGEG